MCPGWSSAAASAASARIHSFRVQEAASRSLQEAYGVMQSVDFTRPVRAVVGSDEVGGSAFGSLVLHRLLPLRLTIQSAVLFGRAACAVLDEASEVSKACFRLERRRLSLRLHKLYRSIPTGIFMATKAYI
jgi:hypothetical protein